MKKILFFALCVLFISCENQRITQLEIEAKNYNDNEIKLSRIDGLSLLFQTNESGKLILESTELEQGFYDLNINKFRQQVYIEPGAQVKIVLDLDDISSSIVFEGDLAPENNYLVDKKEQTAAFDKVSIEVYKKGEIDFLKTVELGTEQDLAVLGQTLGITTRFLKIETQNILFTQKERMEKYLTYHNYYAPESKIESTSSDFDAALPQIDENNYAYYLNSASYRTLLRNKMYNVTDENIQENEDYYLSYLNTIQSSDLDDKIKGLMAYENARNAITYTEELESYFKLYKSLDKNQEQVAKVEKTYKELLTIAKGEKSPTFENYENFNGGTNSLSDFKGKYVYMDIWAQWCGPCKREIPFLKAVEKDFHDKNIAFVSISIDQKKDYDKWRNMVKNEELTGVQLLADNAWNSQFAKDYLIRGIPRFILVDPNGNIVTPNAPRPSDKKLLTLFEELGI